MNSSFKPRRSFTSAKKLQIIKESIVAGIKATSMKYNIHISMIYKWKYQLEKLEKPTNRNKRSIGSGMRAFYPFEEQLVFEIFKRE